MCYACSEAPFPVEQILPHQRTSSNLVTLRTVAINTHSIIFQINSTLSQTSHCLQIPFHQTNHHHPTPQNVLQQHGHRQQAGRSLQGQKHSRARIEREGRGSRQVHGIMQVWNDDHQNWKQWSAHLEMHGIGCEGNQTPPNFSCLGQHLTTHANTSRLHRKAMASTSFSTPTPSPAKQTTSNPTPKSTLHSSTPRANGPPSPARPTSSPIVSWFANTTLQL